METAASNVVVDKRDAFLWITVNRADKANAMTVGMVQDITAAIARGVEDPEIRAVMLTGAGERVFTAGVDVREKPEDGDAVRQRERRSHALAALQDIVMDAPKPVVVVLNGAAIGGGAMLALLADACVAVDSADLALPEIDLGIATFSGANILAVIGGRALALDLIQTGRRMTAAEGQRRGLVRSVVRREELSAAASAVATSLGAKDPTVFADNKRWINRALKDALGEARDEHARHRQQAAK
ncbi:3-hydroxypropionyl-CoA dehydratase [Burkholderia sp. A9]|uniref:enoyl-CoA hydratase/isomerase family protein n=1 Tax=Burkholderia sp. A9 TaxID=1365108 RepID=UPI0005744DF8|nr:enoyl-CoA hydratase/isomerase family protein [Burkholderia sp. A9]KHK59081.1 3-hydroxypropionyl-CoA dehydratase [Burkholderia sp. A9]